MRNVSLLMEPFFLDGNHGRLFCQLLLPATGAVERGLVYIHPFAEEMHKSRRMAAMQGRALAERGCAVLQVDLSGCGDSADDFGDATWSRWRDDIHVAHAWLTDRLAAPIGLWGLRIGATLAVEMAAELSRLDRLLLWQPVIQGEVFLNQFLRIKLAGEVLSAGRGQTGLSQLRARLAAGESLEVGGYLLSATMARDLAARDLAGYMPRCPVLWLELGAEETPGPSPLTQRICEAWRQAGAEVRVGCVSCPPFWLTQEIAECPDLLRATLEAMDLG